MRDNSLPRIVVIIVCTAVFVAVLIVNALAGAGRGEFKYRFSDILFYGALSYVTLTVKLRLVNFPEVPPTMAHLGYIVTFELTYC